MYKKHEKINNAETEMVNNDCVYKIHYMKNSEHSAICNCAICPNLFEEGNRLFYIYLQVPDHPKPLRDST